MDVPGEFVEPVQLQIACQSLWSELPADVTTITSEHLRTFGDVSQALRDFYERMLTRTANEAGVPEGDLRAWFDRHLITQAGTRGTVFRGPEATEGIPNRAVDLLENHHLIRAELRAGARWYELTHDRFIRPIQASNDSWRQRVKVSQLQGQMQASLRRFRFALVILALAGLAIIAYSQWSARRQVESHELAARSLLHISIDPEESLCLAVRAGELDRSATGNPAIEDALRQALREFRMRAISTSPEQTWVRAAAFSPDGKRLISAGFDVASSDTVTRIWDLASNDTKSLHAVGTDVAAVSFATGAPTVLTKTLDSARLLDAATGRVLFELHGDDGFVNRGAFSADGTLLVTAGLDGTARVWNAATGALVQQLPRESRPLNVAVFSHDGTRIVMGGDNARAVIWDVTTSRGVAILVGHAEAILDAAFSADEKLIVTASRDQTLRVWDANNGRALFELRGHTGAVTSAAFSPDDRMILSASEDSTARTWLARSGTPIAVLRGHQGTVSKARFSADGQRAVTVSDDGTTRVWDVSEGQTASLQAHTKAVNSLAFNANGSQFISASDDGTAQVWETRAGTRLGEVGDKTNAVTSAQFSPDGAVIATGSIHLPVQLWDARAYKPLAPLDHVDTQGYDVAKPLFSPDGRWIVTFNLGAAAKLWDARTHAPIADLKGDPSHQDAGRTVIRAAFSPDGSHVATVVSLDPIAYVFDPRAPQTVVKLPSGSAEGHSAYVTDAGFNPDGSLVVTASSDKTARIWNARTGTPRMAPLQHLGYVTSAAFTPDGARIVTGSADQIVRIWSASGSDRPIELRGHTAAVSSVSFPALGATRGSDPALSTLVLTTSQDGSARVWDMTSGSAVMVLPGRAGPVAAAISPDGRTIVTGREEGLVQIYACDLCQSRAGLLSLARSRLTRSCTSR